jgi:hypothetical protein
MGIQTGSSNRNLLLTKTAVGAYISLLATLTAVAPNIEGLLARGKSEADKMSIRDWFAIATAVAGTMGTLIGRYDAGNVYTPKYLPGEDPPERLQ